jgi:hypothetical protein
VRRRFEAVGTSQPTKFDAAGKLLLIDVLEHWMNEVGKDRLPDRIFELRNTLIDDRDRGRARVRGLGGDEVARSARLNLLPDQRIAAGPRRGTRERWSAA